MGLLAAARPRSARAGKGEGKGACLHASLLPAYGLQDARPMKVVLTQVSYIICVRCQNVLHLLTAKSLAVSLAMDVAAFTRPPLWPISAPGTLRLVSPLSRLAASSTVMRFCTSNESSAGLTESFTSQVYRFMKLAYEQIPGRQFSEIFRDTNAA